MGTQGSLKISLRTTGLILNGDFVQILRELLHLLKHESWSCCCMDLVLLLNGTSFEGYACSVSITMKVKIAQSCSTLQPLGLYSPWNSPGQKTGVGSLSLLQGILPTQGSNPALPHCRRILYQLSHQGSPRILEWAGYPFSRGSS